MVTAPQFGQTSSNQKELANYRHAPFAKLTAVATISEEEAAQKQAAFEASRKEAKERKHAERVDAERRRQEARAKAQAPRVTPPTPEGLRLVQSFIIRKSAKPPVKEIPKDVLARGLELDREAVEKHRTKEREQTEAEAAHKELLRLGYIHDVVATALGHLRREDINLEARVLLLEGMGCEYSANAKNGRDAVYFHQKSGAEIIVRNGAVVENDQSRPRKARGVETLSRDELKKRQEANAKLRADCKAQRMASKAPKQKAAKEDKKNKDKKSKKGEAKS